MCVCLFVDPDRPAAAPAVKCRNLHLKLPMRFITPKLFKIRSMRLMPTCLATITVSTRQISQIPKFMSVVLFSTAEEIAVFQASSSDAVENIKKAIDTRLEDLKLAFENYVPGEMTKINNPVLVTKGTTVVLVLADDTASVSDQINELLK